MATMATMTCGCSEYGHNCIYEKLVVMGVLICLGFGDDSKWWKGSRCSIALPNNGRREA